MNTFSKSKQFINILLGSFLFLSWPSQILSQKIDTLSVKLCAELENQMVVFKWSEEEETNQYFYLYKRFSGENTIKDIVKRNNSNQFRSAIPVRSLNIGKTYEFILLKKDARSLFSSDQINPAHLVEVQVFVDTVYSAQESNPCKIKRSSKSYIPLPFLTGSYHKELKNKCPDTKTIIDNNWLYWGGNGAGTVFYGGVVYLLVFKNIALSKRNRYLETRSSDVFKEWKSADNNYHREILGVPIRDITITAGVIFGAYVLANTFINPKSNSTNINNIQIPKIRLETDKVCMSINPDLLRLDNASTGNIAYHPSLNLEIRF